MPHTPQTAVVRLLQGCTDARNIAPGERIDVRPHLIILGPRDGLAALKTYLLAGGEEIPDPDRVILVSDDNLPAPDAAAAYRRKQLNEAAAQAGIKRVIPASGCELAHVLQHALVVPGELAVAGLPEIHQLGGIGALGLRVTTRDLASLLAGKPLSLTVHAAVRVDLTGQRQALVSGRDLFFTLRRETSRDRLVGRALEIGGEGLATLSLEDRIALCGQAAHAGVAAAFCLPDRAAVAELNKRIARPYTTIEPEKDAAYQHRASLDISHAQLSVIPPEGVEKWRTVGEASGEPVSRVVISGGPAALQQALEIIKLRRKNPQVECFVVPDTREVYQRALEQDVIGQLIELGARVHSPGTPAVRLLQGRPGLVTGVVAPAGCWRAGVVAAATAACAGAIVHPERLDAQPQRDSKLSGRRPKT
jgi:3-isopropylmalate/(R)-2-methylmalate dehydratase large subunit